MRIITDLRHSALVGFLFCASCHKAPGADRVLRTYFAHLRAGRIAEAYALTTPSHRARRDMKTFALAVARQSIFESGETQPVQQTLDVELIADDGSSVRVSKDAPRARAYVLDDPLDLYPANTPEAALRSFSRAVASANRERVSLLVAPMLRDRLGSGAQPLPEVVVELGKRIELLGKSGASPIVTDGTSARWLLGEGASISLERGRAGWWLTSFE